jgi:hypothetical protein
MDGQVEREVRDGPAEASTEPGIQPKRQRVPGSGRKAGTPNKVAGQIRKDAGSFFRACTSENLKFRKKLREFCESGEVLKHSHTLAVLLSHALGKPTPKVEQGEAKPPLVFISLADPLTGAARNRPIGSYDPLFAKNAELAARKAARMLPEAAKAEAYVPPDPKTDPDALQIVDAGSIAGQVMGRPK